MEYKIRKYKELSSTNTEAEKIKDFCHLECITAERQTLGRGRMGRSFYSETGGLYMSVLLKPDEIRCPISLVTFAAAISLCDALRSFGYPVSVKWVNDILLDGKKIAGILTEARTEDSCVERIIVGIGVNLKEPKTGFPDELKSKAGALGFDEDAETLLVRIISFLDENLSKQQKEIIGLYRCRMDITDEIKEVTDYRSLEKLRVRILGVSDDGALICREEKSGRELQLVSGEILY